MPPPTSACIPPVYPHVFLLCVAEIRNRMRAGGGGDMVGNSSIKRITNQRGAADEGDDGADEDTQAPQKTHVLVAAFRWVAV